MSKLKISELLYFEQLFDMKSGYVMDFSNETFKNFIEESIGINIEDDKYSTDGTSKAKRLRKLIKVESSDKVSKLLNELLEYWERKKIIENSTLSENEKNIQKGCIDIINSMKLDFNGGEDMKTNPNVFVSYSWDSEEHQEWVLKLVATLRENGINATMDVIETQQGTTNLNHMMVKNIRDSDYIIVVLTENYARKSEKLQGGVGLETTFLYNYLLEDLKKIVPILRQGGNNAIPFHFKGLHYIDFSEGTNMNNSFEDLLYRIMNKSKFEMPEVGKARNLKSTKVKSFNLGNNTNTNESIREGLIPDFSKSVAPTELDKNRFIKGSYGQIKDKLSSILSLTKERNNGFDYEIDELTSLKSIIRVYLNGSNKYNLKIWVSNGFGGRNLSINMSYGNYISDSDSSMNEIIRCNVDKNNELFLNMTMSFLNKKEYMTANEVFEVIWNQILQNIR
ncbi:toll/interleukin-1 receptor domain-containing protein [Paraclostridium benzoelyticum]|nr:toll/interleukin-1 receptor domain-containing protein [Paraclostridium benzoelyticum]